MSSFAGSGYKQPGPPPPTASCYICLENSVDSNDQPLLRNCACRGDAGWAHIACLAEFAASKVTEAQREQGYCLVNIASFWENCILCKTTHMQYMGLAMAKAFVKQYEHLPDTNDLRFHSLYSLASNTIYIDDTDGAVELHNRLLKLFEFLTSTGVDVRGQEANICGIMGNLFVRKGKFNDALSIFERQRELHIDIYGPNSPEMQYNNEIIIAMKKRIDIGKHGHQKKEDTVAELVRARENFRESRECVDIRERLFFHMSLVDALMNNGKIQESIEQFEKLLAESRQSLGPNHPDTLAFENDADYYRQGNVWAVIDCKQQPAISGHRVQVLRATKDARKYICLIRNDGLYTKFKVGRNHFILETGTTVVVHGLVSSTDLNDSIGIICSFDKENCRYAVSVGKKKTAVLIKPINLNVVFT